MSRATYGYLILESEEYIRGLLDRYVVVRDPPPTRQARLVPYARTPAGTSTIGASKRSAD